nr:leucine-rich repeat, cysteine-containing subtype [Tanacetum cinerariifolium]
MAELHFNNDHNKVAYLLKPTESQGFHQIIDFMNGLYIRYALTANPTINASVVSPPPSSPVVASRPSPDPMPSPPRQSSPPPIPYGPAPSSRVVSTEPIPDIPSSSGPSEPVLETITSPIRDDDTGGGSFHKSPPRPPLATLPRSPTEGVAEEPLTLTSLLVLFPTSLHDLSDSTTLFKPANQEQSLEQEISPTTLDAVLTLSQSKARARAATIIYKRIKKQQSSSGLDFTDAAIPTAGLDSAGGLDYVGGGVSAGGTDSANGLTSTGISVAAGPTVSVKPSSPIRDPAKGKAVATPSSLVTAPTDKELADQQAVILEAERQELLEKELKQSLDAEQVYLDSLLAQRVAEEQERESRASAAQSTQRQAELDRVALNLTNEEWIGLVDQVRANLSLSAELLGADVSEDTFSVRMVELMNQRWKVIAEIKAKAKKDKPMTPAQQKEFMRTFVKNQSSAIYTTGWTWKDVRGLTDDQLQNIYDKIRRAVDLATAKDHHQHLKRSGEILESSDSKKLKSSHITTQPTVLQEPTYVFAGVSIAASAPIPTVTPILAVTFIPAVTSVPAGSSIPAMPPSAAGVSTTAGASGSASDASVPIIELLDSPPKDTSIPLDPKTEEQDATLRKPLRKKSIARRRSLATSDDDEPAEPVSLALVSDITSWEIIPTEFGLGAIHVLTRADGTVNRFLDLRTLITAREDIDASIIWDDQDQWEIQSWRFYALPAIHVLETEAGDIVYMFVDKKYPPTPEIIQRMLNHGLEIDRDPAGLMSQMIVYDGFFCHLALWGTMGGLIDFLPFSMLLVHPRFNKAKQRRFKDDYGASSFTFKILMLLLILLAPNPKMLTRQQRRRMTKIEQVFNCVLPYVHDVDDRNSISLVCRRLYELEELQIHRLEVYEKDLKTLAILRGNDLRVLKINKCDGLWEKGCGDTGMQVIGLHCKKLRKFTHAGRVSRIGLIALAQGCNNLEYIKVRRVKDISNEAMECLGTHLKNLRTFSVYKFWETDIPLDNGIRALLTDDDDDDDDDDEDNDDDDDKTNESWK